MRGSTILVLVLVGLVVCSAACGDDDAGGTNAAIADAGMQDAAPDAGTDVPVFDAGLDTSDAPPAFFGVVYGHTRSSLYGLNTQDTMLTFIGDFDCVSLSDDIADSSDGMTDLAVDLSFRGAAVTTDAPLI